MPQRLVLAVCVVLVLSSPTFASTISFSVGISEEMTLVVGVPTAIPAAIINTASTPLDFGCAFLIPNCDGLGPASPFGISQAHDPYLSYVDIDRTQFVGLVLDPGERFDFTLFTFTLESEPPFAIQPFVTFAFDQQFTGSHYGEIVQPTITSGANTAFSPLVFVAAPDKPLVVPDMANTGTLLAFVLPSLCVGRRYLRHHKS